MNLFHKIRLRLAKICENSSPFNGELEVDESYFDPTRVRGKRVQGAGKKTIVFGLLKRNGFVYTEMVQNVSRHPLHQIIRQKAAPDSIVHSDGSKDSHGLVDVGDKKDFREHHGENEFVYGTAHINGIESFWSYAKRRLAKFNGVPAETFYLHLKETEYRFNHRNDDLYQILLKEFRTNPL